MNELLKATGLSVRIGQLTILDNIDLSLSEGEILTIIGPNGAGKSTLLRAILGLQALSAGQIEKHPSLRIGYMPQKLHIDQSLPLTVQRFMALTTPDPDLINECLARTQVHHLLESPLYALSGGETQRVLLARALLTRPNLLVLDEPVQGVDVTGQAKLYELIARLRDQERCGVIMVSHDLHLVMAATDNVICLNQHVCCHGHPDAVSSDPAFLELFGQPASSSVAVYTHHHDHTHGLGRPSGEPSHQGSCHHD